MAAYRCPGCDYVYDESNGAVREGFPAGTRWDDLPEDWAARTAPFVKSPTSKFWR